jgi:hypothetical protein
MTKTKASAAESMARNVAKGKRLLAEVIAGITSDKPQIKYQSGKI